MLINGIVRQKDITLLSTLTKHGCIQFYKTNMARGKDTDQPQHNHMDTVTHFHQQAGHLNSEQWDTEEMTDQVDLINS